MYSITEIYRCVINEGRRWTLTFTGLRLHTKRATQRVALTAIILGTIYNSDLRKRLTKGCRLTSTARTTIRAPRLNDLVSISHCPQAEALSRIIGMDTSYSGTVWAAFVFTTWPVDRFRQGTLAHPTWCHFEASN